MRFFALATAVTLSLTTSAYAGDAPVSPTSLSQTRGFVGLNWTFGANGPTAEGVLGIARVKTDSAGDSRGAKISVHMPLSGGLSFGKVKLTGMTGSHDRMLEAGVGYSTGGVFGTAGLSFPYLSGGVDVALDGAFSGYAGFNTLQDWDVPAAAPLEDL